MDLSKFTEKSQAALMEAQNIATRNQHQAVDVEHLLLALLEQEGGLVPRLFEKAKVAPDLLKAKIEEELSRIPRVSGGDMTGQGTYVTQRLNKLLVHAQDQAKKLKDEYISVEHLVLAMFDEPAGTGIGKIFKNLGLRRDEFLKALTEVRGNQRVTSANPEATYEALEESGRDRARTLRTERTKAATGARRQRPPQVIALNASQTLPPAFAQADGGFGCFPRAGFSMDFRSCLRRASVVQWSCSAEHLCNSIHKTDLRLRLLATTKRTISRKGHRLRSTPSNGRARKRSFPGMSVPVVGRE